MRWLWSDAISVTFCVILTAMLIGLIVMVLRDNGPTCEERGGRQTLITFTKVGSVMVPMYRCTK